MPSNPPDPTTARARRSRLGSAAALALLVLAASTFTATTAGAVADGRHRLDGDTPTTVVSDVGPTSECSPGHIVRRPDCGIPPQSPTDPGGWLQVTLFFLICAAVAAMIWIAVWRSRIARRNRRAAGFDPVELARASGQGVRRSTRSDPTEPTSSNSPDVNAGR